MKAVIENLESELRNVLIYLDNLEAIKKNILIASRKEDANLDELNLEFNHVNTDYLQNFEKLNALKVSINALKNAYGN